MSEDRLFTIGHGNRKAKDFLALLLQYRIEYLIDVRSTPYSKYNPQFNQRELEYFLNENGIKYVFMGASLGGRPKDNSCYDGNGKVDYEIVKTKDFFIQGINRLKTAFHKEINATIMCSESKPTDCHRSKLIGRVLATDGIILDHIDETGKIKDQILVINELNKGLPEFDLFGNTINTTSRKAYL